MNVPQPVGLDLQAAIAKFQEAYSVENYDKASNIFIDCLSRNPANAYRLFANHASGQLAASLKRSYRSEDIALKLDELKAVHPLINVLGVDDPQAVKAIARQREQNIDKGLPSVVLVTQGKSGSVTVANVFNSGFGLPSVGYALVHLRVIDSWARDYARGGVCQATHLDPSRDQVRRLANAGIRKVIVHVRDPRQALISLVHHLDKYPEQLADLKSLAQEGKSVSEKAKAVMRYYESTIKWIQGWVDLEDEIAVYFSTFEDMVADWDKFVDRYIAFYGGYSKHFSMANARNQHAGLDYHFRSGKTDEWRDVFSKQDAAHLSSVLPRNLKDRFGWAD